MTDFAQISYDYCIQAVTDTLPHRRASKLEKLACQRQLRDLDRQHDDDFPFYYDPKAGDRHCRFMSNLQHVKGMWRGQLLVLEPHQVFMHHTLFSWKKKSDGFRRFNKAVWFIPRKNGKSFSAAGIGLYIAFAEAEAGSEVYAGATTEKQAGMVFAPAWQMVSMNKQLQEAFGLTLTGTAKNPTSIYRLDDMSIFTPVVGKPGDGSSPTCGICDEYHEHPTSTLADTFVTGMGARQQPILLIITTAGFNTSYPCYDEFLDAIKILEGSIEREQTFPMIFAADPDADYADFETWKTANPNYGVSIQPDSLRGTYQTALDSLKDRNVLLCKHLNRWTNSSQSWLDMQKWEACEDKNLKLEDFEGQECWLGLDLANRIDLCALMILFKIKKRVVNTNCPTCKSENVTVSGDYQKCNEPECDWEKPILQDCVVSFGKYYLNEERVNKTENQHYRNYVANGHMTMTEGAVTDFRYIEDDLKEFATRFIIKELSYDPKEATMLVLSIREWANFECVEFPQSPALISEPMKILEGMIYSKNIWHNGDPVLRWNMSNVIKKQARGNNGVTKSYYPTKQNDASKIDAAVALICSLGRLVAYDSDGESVYDRRTASGEETILRVL